MHINKKINVLLCILLTFIMLFDQQIFCQSLKQASKSLDKKSLLVGVGIGAAAGVGLTLAAPAIASAIGAAGGIAGIGSAIIGGLAAASGAVLGFASALGAAIASGIGAIAGFIAGIITSPLFIPALIVIGAIAIGIYLYRKHKKNQNAQSPSEVLPNSDSITVTPSDYDMNPVFNPTLPDQISIGENDTIDLPGTEVVISQTPPTQTESVVTETTPATIGESTASTPTISKDLEEAHKKYIQAYQEYTQLVTTGGKGDVKQALEKYRAAYQEYMRLRAISVQNQNK